MKKYVITGGPGIGKTTIIEILASKGYEIIPESARLIIEEEKANGNEIFPWTNLQKFQEKVAEKQIELESKIIKEAFLDRGLIDGFAYSELGGVLPPSVITLEGKNRYEKVFILEPLEFYENDHVRIETQEESLKIHQAIIESFKKFDYELIQIPVLSPEERVNMILEKIR